jgi:N-acetylmuramoyl-L-alanine amidase
VSDSIIIEGNSQPLISVTTAPNPDRFVIAITNASMNMAGEEEVRGVFAHRVRVWQQHDSGNIEIHVREWPAYNIEYGANSVTIRLFRNTLTGMRYDYPRRELHISKETGLRININDIIHNDEYERNRYTLTLPINAEAVLGSGDLSIRDGNINSIVFEPDGLGRTRIVVHTERVLAFTVRETDDAYIIRAHNPREVYPRIVVIDPGHGGSDPGAPSSVIFEKNLNLSIALKLKQLLDQDPSIKAYFTRLDDRDISLLNRAAFANENGDIFVSVHGNAMRGNSVSHGIETYYFNHANMQATGLTSAQLAEIMHRNKLNMTGAFDRRVKSDHMVVLRETNIPAVLSEVGFLTNAAELAKLATDEYQWLIARGLYNGIVEAFSVYTPRR